MSTEGRIKDYIMNVRTIYKSVPRKKKEENNLLKEVLDIVKITDPRKIPESLTSVSLGEIGDYVMNNNINFQDFQNFMIRVSRVPCLMGNNEYI